jgi:hypothetical protein
MPADPCTRQTKRRITKEARHDRGSSCRAIEVFLCDGDMFVSAMDVFRRFGIAVLRECEKRASLKRADHFSLGFVLECSALVHGDKQSFAQKFFDDEPTSAATVS